MGWRIRFRRRQPRHDQDIERAQLEARAMTIEKLLNVPENERGWEEWTFAHAQCVREIRESITSQKHITLPDYLIYPINFKNLASWLINVQQSHNDINSALNLAGVDLQDTDITNDRERPSWIYNAWQELNAARNALKI